MAARGDSLGGSLSVLVEAFARLLGTHLQLAALEAKTDAKNAAVQVGLMAAALPFVLVGYTLGCIALAFYVEQWLGRAGAVGAVAGGNFVLAGIVVGWAVSKLKRMKPFERTAEEARATAQLLGLPVGTEPPGGN